MDMGRGKQYVLGTFVVSALTCDLVEWILSASSCSLDDNHDNLVEGVLDQLNNQAEYGGNRSQPESADAMAKIIVDYCVGSYDRKPKSKTRMSISQIFSNYMNSIASIHFNVIIT